MAALLVSLSIGLNFVGVILVGEARTKPLRLQPQLEPRLVFLHHQAKHTLIFLQFPFLNQLLGRS